MRMMTLTFCYFFLVSCTTDLNVRRLPSDGLTWGSMKGIVYSLPFTQFKIDVTRGIAKCGVPRPGNDLDDNDLSGDSSLIPEIKTFVKSEIRIELVDDGDHMYVIDTDSLSETTKITDITVKWENGKLVSINASADDQTAEVITAVAAGVSKLAIAAINPAAFAPVAAVGGEGVKTIDRFFVQCKSEIELAVTEYGEKKKKLDGYAKKLLTIAAEVKAIKKELETLDNDSAVDCKDGSNSDHPRCKLNKLIEKQKSTEKKLADTTKKLEPILKKISYTETYRWPQTSDELISAINSIDEPKFASWFEVGSESLPKGTKIPPEISCGQKTGVPDDEFNKKCLDNFKSEFDVVFRVGRIGSYGKEDSVDLDPNKESGADGLRYRIPANGYVAVCRKAKIPFKKSCNRDSKDELVAKLESPIHQLGHIFYIPFKSKAFTKANVGLTFDKSGRLTMAKVAQTESSAENMAKTFQGVVDEYAKYKAVAEADKDTELSQLKEQTELLTAKKELKDAQAALEPEVLPLTELQNKIALAEAQKKYLDALTALEQGNPPSASEEELAIINSEVVLLHAEIVRLEALLRRNELEAQLNP